MKILYKKLFFFLKFLIILNICIINSYADIVKTIQVNGNERISKQTIKLFSEIKIPAEINSNLSNTAFNQLYQTGYFEFIDIESKSTEIIINVKENKIIQKIEVYGVKNKTILKEIDDLLKIQEKTSFVKEKVQITKDQIISLLRSVGLDFVKIETLVE